MEDEAKYGVSYIASAPEEFKVGDRVKVISADVHRACYIGLQGRIVNNPNPTNGCFVVEIEENSVIIDFKPEWIRKLPDPISFEDKDNPMDKQVGGSHYKKCKIQPTEYIHANGLDFFQGNIVKYITRFRDKNGKEDLEKAKHYIDMLIEMEYPDNVDFENID